MNKEEILNNDFVNQEIIQTKSNKKIKIAIAIVGSLALIATATLLIGHFQFNWFKSEIYKVDVNISRKALQANYFSEMKTIKSKIGFTNGESDERTSLINSNFVVLQTERKEIGKNDFLNTAYLIITDSKVTQGEINEDLTSFDISDPNKINEFKSNPDGSKYPMAIFSFYENGTLVEVKLPNNMDKYNADSIMELIESVVPRLSRNRTEDISNGLDIKSTKNKSKKTLVEAQTPKEVPEFKGSIYSKVVKRDIEEEKLNNIETQSRLNLESKKEEGEFDFGIKDFKYSKNSKIILTKVNEKEEKAELIQELAKHLVFIKSGDLFQNFIDKEKENEAKEQVIEEWEEDINSPRLRQLGFASKFNFDKSFDLKSLTFLGKTVSISLRVAVTGGKAICQVVIKCGSAKMTIGNTGVTAVISKTYSTGDITLFSFQFPPVPAVGVKFKAGGTISYSVKFDSSAQNKLVLTLGGSIYAKAGVSAGNEKIIGLEGGAKGVLLSIDLTFKVNSKGSLTKSATFGAGAIYVYASGHIVGKEVFNKEHLIFSGWSKTI